MSFRRRLALSCGAAVAVAVVLGSVLAYLIVRDTLREQIDASLREMSGEVSVAAAPAPDRPRAADRRGAGLHAASSRRRDGGAHRARCQRRWPTTLSSGPSPRAGARRSSPTATRRHAPPRPRQPRAGRRAIFLARPLTEVDGALATLRWALGILALAGIGLAVVLSRLAMRTAIRPVAELTETAEHVATTRDLSRRIATQGEDEVSRLATSFNTMLEALERCQRAQRQLVADASHELRTPLTSLRTNLEVLARGGPPDPGDRDRLRADLVAQLEELTALVGDLVELARDDEPEPPRRGRAARPAGRGGGGAGAAPRAGRDASRPTSSPRSSRASRRGSTARSPTCSTTPPSGARRAPRSTCACATAS